MAQQKLDKKLLEKIAEKRGLKTANSLVSKTAGKLGISPQAALVVLAKEQGIGTAIYERNLDDGQRAEIRGALPSIFVPAGTPTKNIGRKTGQTKSTLSPKQRAKAAVEFLIEDDELRERVQDILQGSKHFDRAINQATLVLEDRIRTKAIPPTKLVGEPLVNFAFNEQIAKSVLVIASGDSEDQRGFTQMIRGVVPAFRNKTHHHIMSTFSREEALRVCGFIDVLLRAVDNSNKVK